MTTMRRIDFLGYPLDALTTEETLEEVERQVASRRPHQHVVINAAKVVTMARDPELRSIVEQCPLVNADGQSVVWAARLLGQRVPERVAGIDLMQAVVARAAERGWRIYFLGAREEVVERVVQIYRHRYPNLQVAGWRDGYFSEDEEPRVAATIRERQADVLFVAISSPRKERFIHRWLGEMNVPFAMGVGGSFDVVAGRASRAPLWMQHAGLEWFHRLLQEPRRLGRRYLETNTRFLWMVAKARWSGGA
ncbi:MAG: WecB/TagA/CpsF family glycosyltransferase [Dehalococcoidia bacterium]|nr:WecB/TagA/CpsF family glycosyltransferase [Dehalococcoidia bacterium]